MVQSSVEEAAAEAVVALLMTNVSQIKTTLVEEAEAEAKVMVLVVLVMQLVMVLDVTVTLPTVVGVV
jgi:hypothetical protein